jgi:transcriptional regulator with PAS, ATPase and Fis domain
VFYRLNVLVVHVRLLRERSDDIPPLIDMMLRTLQEMVSKRV